MSTRLATLVARAAGSSKRTRLTVFALIAAAGAAVAYMAPQHRAAVQPPAQQRLPAAAGAVPVPVAAPAQLAPAARRIYPYSIVPGGVANREELAQAIKTDKVVADHYTGFDVAKARPVTVSKPRAVYVSYRKGDKVYWTRKKLMLAEGEILLTDGINELRTRCANRISETPMLPVAADEPSQLEFDASSEEGSIVNTSADAVEDEGFDGQPYQLKTFASMASETPAGATPASLDRFRFSQLGGIARGPLLVSSSQLGSSGITTGGASSGPPPEASRDTTTDSAESPASTDGEEGSPKPEQPGEDPSPFIPAPPLLQPELPHEETEETRPADVPEPATLWLGGVAGAAMLFLRRRQRRG